jgi:catechol 2,3-dioxygenase-like lactoylglutathione lyase family enzyme
MFSYAKTFSSFSVQDLAATKRFYTETLDLLVRETPEGLELALEGGHSIFIYPAPHAAAGYTVLHFVVDDIDKTVDELIGRGVKMEHYDLPEIKTDSKGICRNDGGDSGPKAIAWFKDPSGHIIAVMQEK